MREIQSLADFAVRQALGRKLSDLQLLCRQLIAPLGNTAAAALARGAQFASRVLAPSVASEGVERVACGTQNAARLGYPALAPEPLAICELDPRALKRPPAEVG